MKLLSIVKPPKRLLLIKHAAPVRPRVAWLTILCGCAVLTLIGWVMATRQRPGYMLFVGLLLVLVLVIAARAADMQRGAKSDESILFDREANAISHNGKRVADLTDLDHILVRKILPDEEANGVPVDYALVATLANSRKIPITETYGLPGGKEEIEQAANEIAAFAGVPVEVGERRQTEYWMDMT